MKKILKILLIIVIPLVLGGWYSTYKSSSMKEKTVKFKLEGKEYDLLVADALEEWKKGLMFVKNKTDFDGMIFIFPNKEDRTFWNKNTFVDLDIYWLNDDKIEGKSVLFSFEKTKDITVVSSPLPVNKVVEIIR